jgi:hypothetical protein
MATIEPLRIFVSYARKDGAAPARCLQTDLTKGGLDAWLDTPRMGGGAVRRTEIEHEVDARQATNLESAELPNEAEEAIAEYGRLLLAFSVVGPMLRTIGWEFWKDTLDLLHKADLSAIQEQLP